MARWRAEALKRLPELRDVIQSAESVMELWGDLQRAFERAYRADPPDDSLIGRIYDYADWCVDAPRGADAGRDPLSAVVVSFYEDIPTFKPARDDMPRWFKLSDRRTGHAHETQSAPLPAAASGRVVAIAPRAVDRLCCVGPRCTWGREWSVDSATRVGKMAAIAGGT